MFWITTVLGGIMHSGTLGDFRSTNHPEGATEFLRDGQNRAETEIILAPEDLLGQRHSEAW